MHWRLAAFHPMPGSCTLAGWQARGLWQGHAAATRSPPLHYCLRPACLPACSAPRPSLVLIAPVLSFIVGSMFLAVYWPRDTQPDGGRAVLEGAGVSGAAEPAGQCCSPQLRRNMAARPCMPAAVHSRAG